MICWLQNIENCRFMKVLRYCIYCRLPKIQLSGRILFPDKYLLTVYSFFLSCLQRGIFVAGLREEIVVSPKQILDLMEFGECKFYLSAFCIIVFILNGIPGHYYPTSHQVVQVAQFSIFALSKGHVNKGRINSWVPCSSSVNNC